MLSLRRLPALGALCQQFNRKRRETMNRMLKSQTLQETSCLQVALTKHSP